MTLNIGDIGVEMDNHQSGDSVPLGKYRQAGGKIVWSNQRINELAQRAGFALPQQGNYGGYEEATYSGTIGDHRGPIGRLFTQMCFGVSAGDRVFVTQGGRAS
jgi:hypothetical protein